MFNDSVKDPNTIEGNDTLFIPVEYHIPSIFNLSKKSKRTGNCQVNLYFLSCSCKAYKEKVKLYGKREIRRICKHLYFTLTSDLKDELDTLTKLMLETQFWFGIQNLFKIKGKEREIYIGVVEEKKVILVYIQNPDWVRYIYNCNENSWNTKDVIPEAAGALNDFLQNYKFSFNLSVQNLL